MPDMFGCSEVILASGDRNVSWGGQEKTPGKISCEYGGEFNINGLCQLFPGTVTWPFLQ